MTTDVVDTDELRARLLASAEDLTPLPSAVAQLAHTIHDAESTPEDISDIIRQDPVLTASLLREANSSWVASNTDIVTVERAFILLGRARLLMLAVKGHVTDDFQPALPQYGLAQGQLWQHSVVSATAAGVVRETSPATPGGEALTAALLHDLSKLVLAQHIEVGELTSLPRHASTSEIERQLLDIDHAELGGLITRRWGLPSSICDAIESHHDPDRAYDPVNAHTVAIADALAHDVLENPGGDPDTTAHHRDAVCDSLDHLRISRDGWATMARRTLEAVAGS